MAMAAPSTPTFYASLSCTRTEPAMSRRFLCAAGNCSRRNRLTLSSRLNSSKPSGAGGFVSPENGDLQYELQHGFPSQQRRGSPVFVTLPADAVSSAGQLMRRKAMAQSLRALAAAGVEGLVMEVWWGLVERDAPGVYDWEPYLEIVAMARRSGLKVRAVMAFHQCGTGPGDPSWIPLPLFVREEMAKDPNIAYSDRLGRRSSEYISVGCDLLPVLRGRSPIQAYSDFMRNFRDTFKPFLGGIITGVQVGMGPAGELRYPSCPSQKLACGEFQCYDKYMLASLNACAWESGLREWGNEGPFGAANLTQNCEQTELLRNDKFFLDWYLGMLLLHGERICKETKSIFRGSEVDISAKVSRIHRHYSTQSHSPTRDGYLPIARMFGRYGFAFCCSCFEMEDTEEKQLNPVSWPEGFLRQLLLAVRNCGVSLQGGNYTSDLDDKSFQRVLKTSKSYSDGPEKPSFSFNFVRMDRNLFEYHNWVRFTRFVRQMSDASIFRAKLGFGGGDVHVPSALGTMKVGAALAYY